MSNLAKLKKKATEFEQSRQFDKALAAYESLLRAQEGSEEADIALYNRVGDLQARQGRSADALRSYEQAADLYAERGFLNNAIALYSKILRQSPSHADVLLKLGKLSASKGFRSDARRHFAGYLTAMQRGGRLDAGFVALRAFAEAAPDGEEARQLLAELLVEHGREKEACEQLRPVLAAYERQHRHPEAQAVRERLRTLDPEFAGDDAAAGLSADGDVGFGAGAVPTPRRDASPRATMDGLVLFDPIEAPLAAGDRVADADGPGAQPEDGLRLESGRIGETTAADALGESLATDGLEVFGGGILEAPVEPPSLDGFTATAADDHGARPGDESRLGVPDDLIRGADFVSAEFGGAEGEGVMPAPGILLDLSPASELAGGAAPEASEAPVAPVAPAEGFEATDVGGEPAAEHGAALELVVFEPADEAPSAEARPDAAPTEEATVAEASTAGAAADEPWLTLPDEPPAGEEHSGEAPASEPASATPELTFFVPDDAAPVATDRPELELTVSLEAVEGVADAPPAPGAAADERGDSRPPLALVGDAPEALVADASLPAAPADLPPRAPVTGDALLDFSRQLDAAAPRPWQQAAPAEPASDFVNLGDWLRADEAPASTRMVTEERAPSGDEQADFAEMLRKFKQGVAENVDHEDYDSHYDLGVAFKEMGLVDEAIAAFQKALRGPRNRTRVFEALGQCFLEKGQHTIASSILQRAVGEPGADDQQLVGVLYLLGRAAEATHQKSEALRYYQRVFAVDIEFSDVAQRIGLVEQVTQ